MMNKSVRIISLFILSVAILPLYQSCSSDHKQGSPIDQNSLSLEQILLQNEANARKVFAAKCSRCHSPGSGVVSPIEDITDLEALEASEYVVMGEPQNSSLYLDIVDDLKPSDGKNMLTAEEKEIVRLWILSFNITTDNLGGDDIIDDEAIQVRFSDVQDIFRRSCQGCHNNGTRDNLIVYNQVIRHVIPGGVSASPLYIRISGGNATYSVMPTNGNLISTTDRAIIATWIARGAKND